MADFPITLSSVYKTPLNDIERINGYNTKFTIPYTLLSAQTTATGATDTVTITLGTTPAFFLIDRAIAVVSTAFAGTGGLALIVGTSTTTNGLITTGSVLATGLLQPTTGANTVSTIAVGTSTSSKTLVCVFTNSVSGSPSAVTAGSVDILMNIRNLGGTSY